MTFTIPNEITASFADQAEVDRYDFDIIAAGFNTSGVWVDEPITVSPHSPVNMQTTASAGKAYVQGIPIAYAGGNATHATADATNVRYDLVTLSVAGTLTVVTGTPAANPVFPDPAGKTVLAAVRIAAGATTINATDIVQKAVHIGNSLFVQGLAGGQTIIGGTGSGENLTLRSTSHATAGGILIEGDASYYFQLRNSANGAVINFDSNDYLEYLRSTNNLQFKIGGVVKLNLVATSLTIGADGSAPSLILSAMDGTNAGGELVLNGAAANTDWTIDNDTGTVRILTGSTIPFTIATDVITLRNRIYLRRSSVDDATGSGYSALTRLMDGYELAAFNMDTTNKLTPAIKFMSYDSAFTTENPKLLAGIAAEATEAFSGDTSGGMGVGIYTTPDTPGATSVPVRRIFINQWGGITEASDLTPASFPASTTVGTANRFTVRRSTVATNDDPTEELWQARFTTTDGTANQTAQTLTIPASTTVFIETNIVARRTGGASGTAEDGAAYNIRCAVKNVAGTATIIGSSTTTTIGEDQAGWGADISVTGATAIVRVTGAAGNNVTWHVHTTLRYVGT